MELKLTMIAYLRQPLLLLIVPYGIETTYEVQETKHQNPFNRTLWNWNSVVRNLSRDGLPLLIVPYGIET